MKIFKTVLAASLIALFSTAAFASNGIGGGKEVNKVTVAKEAKTELFKQLKKEISYEAFAVDQDLEGKVYVNFKVAQDGSIKVIDAAGTNQVLTSHVKNALNGSDVNVDPSVAGREFTTKFDFFIVQ